MLSVEHISKSLGGLALKDMSFEVWPEQYFVLLGRTGVGKSVLLETIAGLIQPDSGRISLDGRDVTKERIQKREISLVFQHNTLFPHMTVYENIAYPLRGRETGIQIRQRVNVLAEEFEVSHLLNRKPRTLSGGEAQRVSLARAVAKQPQCLLLDEPLSSLDVESRSDMRAILRRIHYRGRQKIIHVTHDYIEAVSLGTHIAVMEEGRITQTGTVREVFHCPKSEYVARFVGIRNFFKGYLEKRHENGGRTKRFTANGVSFSVLTDSNAGRGYIVIRSEDITISNVPSQTSARNNFKGTIMDIVPVTVGVEVIVDIGAGKPVKVAALITAESVKELELQCGKKIWVSFKASAIQYVEE